MLWPLAATEAEAACRRTAVQAAALRFVIYQSFDGFELRGTTAAQTAFRALAKSLSAYFSVLQCML